MSRAGSVGVKACNVSMVRPRASGGGALGVARGAGAGASSQPRDPAMAPPPSMGCKARARGQLCLNENRAPAVGPKQRLGCCWTVAMA